MHIYIKIVIVYKLQLYIYYLEMDNPLLKKNPFQKFSMGSFMISFSAALKVLGCRMLFESRR